MDEPLIWERLLTVTEYFDWPRAGVAHFEGRAHFYSSEFDEVLDDYTGNYFLTPIDDPLLVLMLEQNEIWRRWSNAFQRGEADIKTHPALPEDRARDAELKLTIKAELENLSAGGFKRTAQFRWTARQAGDEGEVAWTAALPSGAKTRVE